MSESKDAQSLAEERIAQLESEAAEAQQTMEEMRAAMRFQEREWREHYEALEGRARRHTAALEALLQATVVGGEAAARERLYTFEAEIFDTYLRRARARELLSLVLTGCLAPMAAIATNDSGSDRNSFPSPSSFSPAATAGLAPSAMTALTPAGARAGRMAAAGLYVLWRQLYLSGDLSAEELRAAAAAARIGSLWFNVCSDIDGGDDESKGSKNVTRNNHNNDGGGDNINADNNENAVDDGKKRLWGSRFTLPAAHVAGFLTDVVCHLPELRSLVVKGLPSVHFLLFPPHPLDASSLAPPGVSDGSGAAVGGSASATTTISINNAAAAASGGFSSENTTTTTNSIHTNKDTNSSGSTSAQTRDALWRRPSLSETSVPVPLLPPSVQRLQLPDTPFTVADVCRLKERYPHLTSLYVSADACEDWGELDRMSGGGGGGGGGVMDDSAKGRQRRLSQAAGFNVYLYNR